MNWRMVLMMNKMRKMKNKKGFTLMEMLIVVAIIAILIAIAIPTFASSLNKARIATDEANIRAGYAAVMARCSLTITTMLKMVMLALTPRLNITLKKDGSVATTDNRGCLHLHRVITIRYDVKLAVQNVGSCGRRVTMLRIHITMLPARVTMLLVGWQVISSSNCTINTTHC